MKACERLLNYVAIRTPSDESAESTPTTKGQFILADYLERELKELGVQDVIRDEKCFVYAAIPATPGYEKEKKLGFIAHMDTVAEFCDHDITPILTKDYSGCDLTLDASGRILSIKSFPDLVEAKEKTLITSDGTTILGVDDKAGIAEIVTMVEELIQGKIVHGPLRIAFTPDEECGSGIDSFNLKYFDAQVAYTLDGDGVGEIQYQNFNACEANFVIKGVAVHPGSAKNIMVNAVQVATEINGLLPAAETPRYTKGYEGFYHLLQLTGDETKAMAQYIIRDHDDDGFKARKQSLRHIEKTLNERYGEGTVHLEIKDEYRNMETVIKEHMDLIENAKEACKRAKIIEKICPIRGGTDGAKLSFKGLPCPNLGTGGHGYHGPFEHIAAEDMDLAVKMLIELVKVYAKQ